MKLLPKSEQLPTHSDKFYFCKSKRFAVKITIHFLIQHSESFYKNPVKRYMKDVLSSINIYDKLRLIDKKKKS